MSNTVDDAMKLIGKIKCTEAIDLGDGTMKITFDYDQKFKDEYKRLFGLKRFSKKHFEFQLEKAIKNFAEQVEKDKGILELKEEIIKTYGGNEPC